MLRASRPVSLLAPWKHADTLRLLGESSQPSEMRGVRTRKIVVTEDSPERACTLAKRPVFRLRKPRLRALWGAAQEPQPDASPERRLPSLVGPGPEPQPQEAAAHLPASRGSARNGRVPPSQERGGQGSPSQRPSGEGPRGEGCAVRGSRVPWIQPRRSRAAQREMPRSSAPGANTSGYPETEREGGPREMERFRPALV